MCVCVFVCLCVCVRVPAYACLRARACACVRVHMHVHASTHKLTRASANTRIRMPRAHAHHPQQPGGGRSRECAGFSAIHSVWLFDICIYGCVCVCVFVCRWMSVCARATNLINSVYRKHQVFTLYMICVLCSCKHCLRSAHQTHAPTHVQHVYFE